MSRNEINMEDLFRSQMESYTVDPSPGLWQKVHMKILWKQFLSFSFQTFNVYYLAAAISLAGLGTLALISDSVNPEQEKNTENLIRKESNISLDSSSETETMEQESAKGAVYPDIKTESKESDEKQALLKSTVPMDPGAESGQISQAPGNLEFEKPSPVSPQAVTGDIRAEISGSSLVKAEFTASLLSGCSPLAVNFRSLSENASQHNWIFSDGGSSLEKDPSYVFDLPGEYPVILKIIGNDGIEYSTQKTIRVFETPKALFELDEAADPLSKQPVYFYNYSQNADFYEWDFGDQERSNLTEPIHYYDHPGSYNIRLKVWTDNMCYDSLIILNAFTGPESEILFPNAFTPNLTGPTGGKYDMNDIDNAVFHPHVSGDLIEYQLKIFNRQGLQIFQSNDAAFGWDGYYQEKLAAQDVYIWKARGKFSNGKTFVKSGDVTLIRKY
ncbi:PKD domain-containing protein [Bacteroidota bacterium]